MKNHLFSVRALAREERQEFAELLDGLSPQQWQAPTLCNGWNVGDVVAHTIAYLGQTRMGLVAAMLAARGQIDRLNESALRTAAGTSRAHAGRRRSLGRGGAVRLPGGAHRMPDPPAGHPASARSAPHHPGRHTPGIPDIRPGQPRHRRGLAWRSWHPPLDAPIST